MRHLIWGWFTIFFTYTRMFFFARCDARYSQLQVYSAFSAMKNLVVFKGSFFPGISLSVPKYVTIHKFIGVRVIAPRWKNRKKSILWMVDDVIRMSWFFMSVGPTLSYPEFGRSQFSKSRVQKHQRLIWSACLSNSVDRICLRFASCFARAFESSS